MLDRYAKLFCIGYMIAIFAFVAMSILVAMFFNFDIPPGACIATIMGGSVFAATKYAEEIGEVPDNELAWKYALRWSILSFVISAVMIAGFLVALPEIIAVLMQYPSIVLIVLFFLFVLCVLLIRLTFPMFVKLQLNAIEKKNTRK